jgi:low temperature requirement protein LtrA
MSIGGHLGWLRERGEGQAEVRPVELFFDLVYVLAVTQLTHHLLDYLSLAGAGETLLLLLAVWGPGYTPAGSPTISTRTRVRCG